LGVPEKGAGFIRLTAGLTYTRVVNSTESEAGHLRERWLLAAVMLFSALLATVITVSSRPKGNLFDLSNLVGPTAESVLQGHGITACTEAMGTPGNPICFHSGRMPLATLVVVSGIKLVGMDPMRVDLLKMVLFLLPVELAIFVTWRRLPNRKGRIWATAGLLLAPFLMPSFLADVANMQVEEAYSYSLLALSVALLLFQIGRRDEVEEDRPLLWGLIFALSTAGTYLAKSSMILVVAVLVLSYLWLERRTRERVLVLVFVLAAPVGWAIYQHHASGRFSVGTSIDGINLHKSNQPEFLGLYPPQAGATLDGHDRDLNRGLVFADEWTFNDYHQKAALAFIKAHPSDTLRGDERKLWVMFVALRKIGSSESTGGMLAAETLGLVLFRLILWAALAGAVVFLARGARELSAHSLAGSGLIFLAVVGTVVFPYLVGFAYTRHVSVLIYPAALMCCRLLAGSPDRERRTAPS